VKSQDTLRTDFLVIGSGIAGLWFAYRAARLGKVLIVTKKSDTDSNTNYAQGGIAAAFGADDSPDLHHQDTLRAGEGLCRENVVKTVAEEGPRLIRELYDLGVQFDTYRDSHSEMHFQLAREGGHLRARIVHAKDHTGQEVEHGLVRAVATHPNVALLENHFACDLLLDPDARCRGCVVIDETSGAGTEVRAPWTLLASGGIGQVYAVTTNPPIATGDGIAMAFRAGARIANMEFIQFHPTALYGHRIDGRAFLISEAVRGEGGLLKTQDGRTFMERYHELGNLAPRDVVARAIDSEMKKRGEDFVLLDMTHLNPERVKDRFPNIHGQCLKFGIDVTRQPIPVVPAAHYVCGGIDTTIDGETNIPGLLAAGECACSGLHGANRLASNSLLEALVLADRAARRADSTRETESENRDATVFAAKTGGVPIFEGGSQKAEVKSQESKLGHAGEEKVKLAGELKTTMARYAAIVRTDAGLSAAWVKLQELKRASDELTTRCPSDVGVRELSNMVTIACLIVHSALQRRESRGLHYNADYPCRDDVHHRRDTVVTKESVQ
jgi:L-aspartate oxidase